MSRSLPMFIHAAWLLFIMSPPSARAQDSSSVRAGERIRVTTVMTGEDEGTLRVLSHDSLVFSRPDGSRGAFALPEIQRLEVARGTETLERRMAAGGAFAGAIVGAILGSRSIQRQQSQPRLFPQLGSTGAGGVAGALLGALGGAVVGDLAGQRFRTTRWLRVTVNGP